jgi:enoyl-CoA hydratase/carnithine racemase
MQAMGDEEVGEKVLFERRGRVALFTLNRPDQRNAVDPDVTRLMNEHVAAFEADDDLWVGVVTGAGDKAFCAGADLKAIANGQLGGIVDAEPYGFAGLVRGTRHKPVIAAVDGPALAGGTELAIACDLIVASERARFGLPEVRRGIIAGAGGLQRLPQLIPPMRALELILTGRPIDAAQAHALGLVNHLVPAGEALPRALELAAEIAANAPIAVRESLAVARVAIGASEAQAWARAEESWPRILGSEDAAEGPRAFAEGREAVWQGR